jgi:hypothetical protein
VASNSNEAEQLLAHALTLPFEELPHMSIPAANRDGIDLLKRHHFHQESLHYFMRCGEPVQRERMMIYGLASPALG